MCGICGVVGSPDQDLLKKMCGIMKHRGPDDEGYFIDKDIGLGIRRLSIIDLETGHQPIYNEDRTVIVVLNGEIYNYKELAYELKAKGHRFYTNSDTEVLVHLYEDLKEDCLDKLRGMFAFAIWDKDEEKLFLARDRLGIKPLYYTYQDNVFLFASEIKALLEDGRLPRSINILALDYYLSFLYIPAPMTIFKGINKLTHGHYLTLKKGNLNVKHYWRLNFTQDKQRSVGFYKDKIISSLKEAIKSHLVSDVPLGVFLSGGIDSSAIVALMHQLGAGSIKTFSIGYEESFASYNELEYSRLIAKRFNTQHQEFIVKPDIREIIPAVVRYLDEPFADSSAILNYLISKEASQHVKVALSGIGGDEVFGGYPRYIGADISSYYDKLPYLLRHLLQYGSSYIKSTSLARDTSGRLKRFLQAGLLTPQERYLAWITYFDYQMKDEIYNPDIKQEIKQKKECLHLKYFQEIINQDYLSRVVYVDINTYLPDDLLIMADRMSMANSLELRVPFCDHRLMDSCFAIPYQLKLKGLRLKGLFKESLKNILPQEIINKPKQGFMIPLADWLREDLKTYVSQILSKENIKKRGYFNPDYVEKILKMHFTKEAVLTHQIWSLLVLELWLEGLDNKEIE